MSKLDAKSLARIRFRLTSLLTVLSARLMTERTFHLPTVEKTEKLLRRAENAIHAGRAWLNTFLLRWDTLETRQRVFDTRRFRWETPVRLGYRFLRIPSH